MDPFNHPTNNLRVRLTCSVKLTLNQQQIMLYKLTATIIYLLCLTNLTKVTYMSAIFKAIGDVCNRRKLNLR